MPKKEPPTSYSYTDEDVEMRAVTISSAGEIAEVSIATPFGVDLPQVGDVVANLWPDDETEAFEVAQRIFVMEYGEAAYWLFVVKEVHYDTKLEKLFAAGKQETARQRKILDTITAEREKEALKKLRELVKSKQRKRKKRKSVKRDSQPKDSKS